MCFNDYDDNEYYKYYNAYDDGEDHQQNVVHTSHSNNDDYVPSSTGFVVPSSPWAIIILIALIYSFYDIFYRQISDGFVLSIKTLMVCLIYTGISYFLGRCSSRSGGFVWFVSFTHILILAISGVNALSTLDSFNLLAVLFALAPVILFFIGREG